MKEKDFRLCYVRYNILYFTDNFENQWGDDWDDAPYEHNAGEPYDYDDEPTVDNTDRRGHIRYLAYMDWNFWIQEPKSGCHNSRYSVDDINNGAVPWLYCDEAGGLMAGATMEQAIAWLKKAGCTWGELK